MSPAHVLSDADVVRLFGDPAPFLHEDGSIGSGWPAEILSFAALPAPLPLSWNRTLSVSRFRCHRRLSGIFEATLAEVHAMPEAWETIGDFGGCYEWRSQRRAPKERSRHGWGIPIDLDVCDNPFSREPRVHPAIVRVFESRGFYWGGRFPAGRRDGMHFEFADPDRLA